VRIAHPGLIEGVPIVLYSGSLTREYFGFQDLIVANRGEGLVPIWTTGLVR